MRAEIEIPEDTDEFQLLEEIVAKLNAEGQPMTTEQFVNNIVLSWLRGRIKEEYINYVTRQDIATLRAKLGGRQQVKTHGKS
ncbi:MAG: hypothetical protein AMJ84_02945 [Acidithiobacillales bacterium SM23_46]|nr:MAG: hypothetical protein AMJ84_02945 [Acidithiobacillales bacterium SM23_46]KPL27890.1 MAG: hypothetical protein AMJ72_06370 [Acidithiobacillales bacterium SM1_46]